MADDEETMNVDESSSSLQIPLIQHHQAGIEQIIRYTRRGKPPSVLQVSVNVDSSSVLRVDEKEVVEGENLTLACKDLTVESSSVPSVVVEVMQEERLRENFDSSSISASVLEEEEAAITTEDVYYSTSSLQIDEEQAVIRQQENLIKPSEDMNVDDPSSILQVSGDVESSSLLQADEDEVTQGENLTDANADLNVDRSSVSPANEQVILDSPSLLQINEQLVVTEEEEEEGLIEASADINVDSSLLVSEEEVIQEDNLKEVPDSSSLIQVNEEENKERASTEMIVGASNLVPLIQEENLEKADSSSLLQVDGVLVVEEDGNIIKASSDIDVDLFAVHAVVEEVIVEEIEEENLENVGSSSLLQIDITVGKVIVEENLTKASANMDVDSFAVPAEDEEVIVEEIEEDNLQNVDSSSLLQVDGEVIVEEIQEENLQNVGSSSLLQVDEVPVEEEENLTKASANMDVDSFAVPAADEVVIVEEIEEDNLQNVDSSSLLQVDVAVVNDGEVIVEEVQEENLQSVDSSSVLQVDEVPVVVEEEENLVKASMDMDVELSAVPAVVEEVIVEEMEEENLQHVDSSSLFQVEVAVVIDEEVQEENLQRVDSLSLLQVDEVPVVVKEEENLIKASADMDVDLSAVPAVVEEVIVENLQNVDSFSLVQVDVAVVNDEEVSVEQIEEENLQNVYLSSLLQVDEVPVVEDDENLIKASVDTDVNLSAVHAVAEEVIAEEVAEENLLNVDSSSLLQVDVAIVNDGEVIIEEVQAENLLSVDSSSLLQVDEVPVVVEEEEENLVKASVGDLSVVPAVVEEVIVEEMEEENLQHVDPSSLLQVKVAVEIDEEVQEENLQSVDSLSLLQVDEIPVAAKEEVNLIKDCADMDVDLSAVPAVVEEVIVENLPNVDSFSLLQVDVAVVNDEEVSVELTEEENLQNVDSLSLLQVDEVPVVVEDDENLIKASSDTDVNLSAIHAVAVEVIAAEVEEENLQNVDPSSLLQVDEEENACSDMNVDSCKLVSLIEEGNIEKADTSSLLQEDGALVVVEEEENFIKASVDMDVDSSSSLQVDVPVLIDQENLVKASTDKNMDLSSIIEEVALLKADSFTLLEVDEEESPEKASNELNVNSPVSVMEEEEEEAIQTEDVVQALIEHLVEPVLPIQSCSSRIPDDATSLLIAKQMHAVVLLYNYYHRKQFPHLEFLDFESFCKVSVNATPGLCGHLKFMDKFKSISGEPEDLLSPTDKAIQDACNISIGLDASKDAPCTDGWPVSKVAVFLTDSTRNCFLVFSATTEGVWSLIEKTNDDYNCKLDDETENLKENKKNKTRKWPLGGDKNADQVSFRQLAFSIVEEATGIGRADLRVLENHVVPSLSAERSTACFFLMKCIKPFREDLTQVPIEDAINSLHGPLVKMEYGSCSVCEVVNYFHLLPYAGVLSNWLPRAGLEEATMEDFRDTDDFDSDSASLHPVTEEPVGEENAKEVDSSPILQVDGEEVIQEENSIELSAGMNVESYSTQSVVEDVIQEESCRNDFNERSVHSSSISASSAEEAVNTESVDDSSSSLQLDGQQDNQIKTPEEMNVVDPSSLLQVSENAGSSSLLQLNEDKVIEGESLTKAFTDLDVDRSSVLPASELVMQENDLKEVDLLQVNEELVVVEKEEGLTAASTDNHVDSSLLVPVEEVIQENNCKEVPDSLSLVRVNENQEAASTDVIVGASMLVPVIQEGNLGKADSSSLLQVDEVLVVEEEENLIKASVDMDVDLFAVPAVVADVVFKETEDENPKIVDSFSLLQIDVAELIDQENLVKADSSSLLEVDEEESLRKAYIEMNVDSTSILASAVEEEEQQKEAIQTEDVVQALLEYLVEPVLPIKSSSSGIPDDSTSLVIAKQMHAVVLLYNYYHRKQFPHLEFLDFESFCKVSVNAIPHLCGQMKFMQMRKSISGEPEDHLSHTEKAIQDACNISIGLDASKDSPCTDRWPISKVAIFLTDSTKNCFLVFSATTKGVWSLIEKTNDDSDRKLEDKLEKLKGNKWPLRGDINADQVSFRQLAFSIVEEATGIGQADLRVLENHVVPSLSAEKSTACFYLMKCIKPFSKDLTQVSIKDAINSLHGPLVKMEYGSCSVCKVVDYFHLLPYAGVLFDWLPRAGLEEANTEDLLAANDSDGDLSSLLPVTEELIEEQNIEKVVSSTLLQVDEEIVVETEAENLIKASASTHLNVDSSTLPPVVEEVIGEVNTRKGYSFSLTQVDEVVVQEKSSIKLSTDKNLESCSIPSVAEEVIEEESLQKDFNETNVDSSSISASITEEAITTENVVQALLDHLVLPAIPVKSSSSEVLDDSASLLLENSIAIQMHAVVLLYNYYHRKQFPHLEFLDFESFCKVSAKATPGLLEYMKFTQRCKSLTNEPENLLSPTEKAIQDACNISLRLDASKDVPCTEGWPVSKVAIFLIDSMRNCFLVYGSTTQGVWSLIEEANDYFSNKLGGLLEKQQGNKKKKIRKWPLGGDRNTDEVSYRRIAFSIVKEATGIGRADLRVIERHVVPSLSAEKSTACFYLMKCIKPFSKDLTQVPIEDAINSLHGPLVKMEYDSCSVCEVVNYFHLLPYAGVLSNWLPRAGLEEANIDYFLATDDSESDILVESCKTPAIPSSSSIVGNKRRRSSAEKINKNPTTEGLNKYSTTERVNKNSTAEPVEPSTTERVNMDGSVATTNNDPVIHINKKMKSSTDSVSRNARKRKYEAPLVQVDKVDVGKEAEMFGRTTTAEVPCGNINGYLGEDRNPKEQAYKKKPRLVLGKSQESPTTAEVPCQNINLSIGNFGEEENPRDQAYELITQNLKKKPNAIPLQIREMLQVSLRMLHTRCNELSGLQRDLQDHIAICERYLQTMPNDGDLTDKIERILDACNVAITRASLQNSIECDQRFRTISLPQDMKSKKLSEAVLNLPNACKDLDTICRQNNWTLPTYNLMPSNGFRARVVVQGVDFECSEGGHVKPDPREARESAAIRVLTKMQTMQQDYKD